MSGQSSDVAPTTTPPVRPLEGVVVADLSRVLAGPLATMMLADLGATVIKVEAPEGDDTRRWGPPWTPDGSSYFESVNRSKHSVCLDFREPADLRAAQELVRRADVVVENFRVGGLDAFGLDHITTMRDNPRLVYCSVTGFGSAGGAALPGYDFIVQALGGLMSITGEPHGEPQKVGVALVDVLTGKDAVVGILAALRQRDITGRGQHVEVDLLSSLLGSLVNQASSFFSTGVSPQRLGNRHPSIAPYETLRCHHGVLAVACGNDRQFARLCEVLDIADAVHSQRFSSNAARVLHRDELTELLESRLRTGTAGEWESLLTAAGVPCGQVQTIEQAFTLSARLGMTMRHDMGPGHPDQVAHPVTYSGFDPCPPTRPPAPDQHGPRVRAWLDAPAEPFTHDENP